MHDIEAALVYPYSPENIGTSIVDGRVPHRGRRLSYGVKEAELAEQVREERNIILQGLWPHTTDARRKRPGRLRSRQREAGRSHLRS